MKPFGYNECCKAILACKLEKPMGYGSMKSYFDPVRLYDEVRCVYGYDLYIQCLYDLTKECMIKEGVWYNGN